MKKDWDLQFVCGNLANLAGIPVRLYEGKELLSFYSLVRLPVDPAGRYLEEIFAIKGNVGYLVTPHEYYYGVVRFGSKRLVLGPTRMIPQKEQELHELAFEWEVHKNDLADFLKGMKSLAQMPLMRLLQILSLTNCFLNDGETLSLSDISIREIDQEALKNEFESAAAERVIADAEGESPSEGLHDTMDVETFMMNAIRRGDTSELQRFFANPPALSAGIIAEDDLRQAKNTVIVAATLASRAAMQGGMDAEEALTLSDSYIRKCERMTAVEEIVNLNYRLVMDYTERMERLLYGHANSPLVTEVISYLRRHLSEPVSVEKLARHLCRGRSRLSTDFKKETGEKLSDFILKQKIEEAKRLLAYSDKSCVDIALYLGFSSQSHFTRTFKKIALTTPNEYRIAQKNK